MTHGTLVDFYIEHKRDSSCSLLPSPGVDTSKEFCLLVALKLDDLPMRGERGGSSSIFSISSKSSAVHVICGFGVDCRRGLSEA